MKMNKGLLFVFAIWTLGFSVKSQTLKTAVLVVGNGNSAVAAALQAAASGVKTIILMQSDHFEIEDPKLNLQSGIESGFLQRMRNVRKGTDSTTAFVIDPLTSNEVIKTWTDTTKNLTVVKNVTGIKLSHSGGSWTFKLSDGRTIKAKILVSADGKNINGLSGMPIAAPKAFNYTNNEYRTSIGSGFYVQGASTTSSFITLKTILPAPSKGEENLVLADVNGQDMLVGQAAGAVAAYAAFFDTRISDVKLKEIQGELLNYKLALVPFGDVPPSDPNWKAMQNIALMGILKAEIRPDKLLFWPDVMVNNTEIAQPLKDLYYKAQIWFDDHKNDPVTLENTIAMVCYIGNKSLKNTTMNLEKKWKSSFKFEKAFDLKRTLSRREFSAILTDYLQPLEVNVDQTGRVMR